MKSNLVNIVLGTEKSDLLGSFYITRNYTLYSLVGRVKGQPPSYINVQNKLKMSQKEKKEKFMHLSSEFKFIS